MKRPTPWQAVLFAAGLAVALGLAVSAHTVVAQKAVTLPDVPLSRGQATVLPNGWQVTPAGRPIPLPGDMPLKMLFSPDGKYLLVNTGGYHDQTVNVIDAAAEKVVQSVNVGKDWAGMCLDAAGDTVYVSGGGAPSKGFLESAAKKGATPAMMEAFKQPVLRLAYADGQLTPQPALAVNGLDEKARYVAGLAAGRDGALYVVNLQNDTVYRLDGRPLAVRATATVGYRPYAAALSPDGKTLAVSNWGDQSISLLDAATLKSQAKVKVGSRPNDLVYAPDGRLFVANAGSNSVSAIKDGKVAETITTSLTPRAPVGSTPVALAVSPEGTRLYVANADNNDVAVIDTSDARESKVLGFIPTGWYPSALAVSPDGKKLYVGTAKGLKFRPNFPAAGEAHTTANSPQPYDYIGNVLSGAVSVVDVPDAAQLAAYTRQVTANVPLPKVSPEEARDIQRDAFSKIRHVVYIIRENRTYDQVFGDIKAGNGDPSLTLFGESVTPNAHKLAGDFVLLDNLYCNGDVSEDGHEWCDSAYATDYIEKAWPLNYGGRGEPDVDGRLRDSPAGYLWDNCARHGITYRAYGERADFKSNPSGPPTFLGPKTLKGHASEAYSKFDWFEEPRDLGRAEIFIRDLRDAEKDGRWPQFMVMSLPEDHTQGLKAGGWTPAANVAENDQAVGKIVEAVSHSSFWKETAIFIIEDDAQNGPDHVDAHRTVGLVISPYVRRGAVDSTMYSTASFVRTIELMLGLPPMTQYDAAATPLYSAFTPQPVLTAYNSLPARVDLEAKNPTTGHGAAASAKLDLSAPDRCDPDVLNAILWHALKPGVPMPAPVRSARLLR